LVDGRGGVDDPGRLGGVHSSGGGSAFSGVEGVYCFLEDLSGEVNGGSGWRGRWATLKRKSLGGAEGFGLFGGEFGGGLGASRTLGFLVGLDGAPEFFLDGLLREGFVCAGEPGDGAAMCGGAGRWEDGSLAGVEEPSAESGDDLGGEASDEGHAFVGSEGAFEGGFDLGAEFGRDEWGG
jgi:hypothetical protein